jgi:hypothetical protein
MYRNAQKFHFVHGAPACAKTSHQDHKVPLMVVATAIILLWIACFSTLTGPISTELNVVVQPQTSDATINGVHKAGLAPANFYERWNAIVEINKASQGAWSVEQIPEGCEPAFSRLVKVGNFSTRCVVNVNALTKLAAVE